jgi:hypothetical protein
MYHFVYPLLAQDGGRIEIKKRVMSKAEQQTMYYCPIHRTVLIKAQRKALAIAGPMTDEVFCCSFYKEGSATGPPFQGCQIIFDEDADKWYAIGSKGIMNSDDRDIFNPLFPFPGISGSQALPKTTDELDRFIREREK